MFLLNILNPSVTIIYNARIYPVFSWGTPFFWVTKAILWKFSKSRFIPRVLFFLTYKFFYFFNKLICDFRMNNIAKFTKQNIHHYIRYIIETLRASLMVKCNLLYSCFDFYKSLSYSSHTYNLFFVIWYWSSSQFYNILDVIYIFTKLLNFFILSEKGNSIYLRLYQS